MSKTSDSDIDNMRLGKKLIDCALKLEDNLAEILSVQVMHMKHLNEKSLSEEMVNTHKLLKSIIYSLMITDDRITRGLEMYGVITKINNDKPSWLATKHMEQDPK